MKMRLGIPPKRKKVAPQDIHMTKHFVQYRARYLIMASVLAILTLVFFPLFNFNRERILYFQSNIRPGISTTDLVRIAGVPTRIVHRGESLGVATQVLISFA